MEDRIHLTIDDGVADVSLARPTKLNALDPYADRLRRFNQILEHHYSGKERSLARLVNVAWMKAAKAGDVD